MATNGGQPQFFEDSSCSSCGLRPLLLASLLQPLSFAAVPSAQPGYFGGCFQSAGGGGWSAARPPKVVVMDYCLCPDDQIIWKIDEQWEEIARKQEVKARRHPGTMCHKEKWERFSSGIQAKDALSFQGGWFQAPKPQLWFVVA